MISRNDCEAADSAGRPVAEICPPLRDPGNTCERRVERLTGLADLVENQAAQQYEGHEQRRDGLIEEPGQPMMISATSFATCSASGHGGMDQDEQT